MRSNNPGSCGQGSVCSRSLRLAGLMHQPGLPHRWRGLLSSSAPLRRGLSPAGSWHKGVVLGHLGCKELCWKVGTQACLARSLGRLTTSTAGETAVLTVLRQSPYAREATRVWAPAGSPPRRSNEQRIERAT